jgi:5-methylcytosine-specific restriction enzyme subunit McrC
MLVYPKVDRVVAERYRIKGFDVSLRTVDMNQSWSKIHEELIFIFRSST